MISTLTLLAVLILAIRASLALHREADVRREFGQSRTLDRLVWLLPLAALVLIAGPLFIAPVVRFGVAAAWFVATMVVASRQANALETAGTDRVKGALAATTAATLAAMVGLIGIGVSLVFAFVAHSL